MNFLHSKLFKNTLTQKHSHDKEIAVVWPFIFKHVIQKEGLYSDLNEIVWCQVNHSW